MDQTLSFSVPFPHRDTTPTLIVYIVGLQTFYPHTLKKAHDPQITAFLAEKHGMRKN
jgi:hypothetical protein